MTYIQSGAKNDAAISQEEAVAIVLEKYKICFDLFRGFDCHCGKAGVLKNV